MKIILTHDADSIKKPFRHIWRRRDRFSTGDLLRSALRTRNLYNNIEDLASLEERHGFHSTFFIPAFLFNIDEVSDTLRSIKNSGWEVQLHYVHHPTQSEGLFRVQKEYFKHKIGSVEGVRTHNLEVSNETLEMFRKDGIVYDSSYRRETVGTYDVYRIKGHLREIPVGIMDTDVFGRLMLDENEASRYILWKIQKAREEKARYFSILFHQESYRMKGGRLYKELIGYLAKKGYEAQRCIDAARSAR
jgi:peptidoglycan/xylan/chitin deacetylase (PgdA/CDA1 family)